VGPCSFLPDGSIYGDGSRPSARALAISGCCRWCRKATTTEPSTFTRYQDAVFELAKVGPSNVFDDRRVLVGILADSRHGFVDALQELITEARLLRIVPFAGLLDVNGGQRREANRMRQRGDGGSGRRAFRSASTSSHGRAAFASSSKVSSRSRMMRSISGVTGRSLSSASAAPGQVGRTGAGLLMGLG